MAAMNLLHFSNLPLNQFDVDDTTPSGNELLFPKKLGGMELSSNE